MRAAACFLAALLLLSVFPAQASEPAAVRAPVSSYPDYETINQTFRNIAATHSSFAAVSSLAKTYQSRDVLALRLGTKGKPAALVMGGHHGREAPSVKVPFELAKFLSEGYETNASIRWLLGNREIWIVPLVNPDGYEYVLKQNDWNWRKNRKDNGDGTFGVDLNRNYAHLWGMGAGDAATSSDTYHGTAPFSEPETRGIRDLALRVNFTVSVSFHTFGETVSYPWNNDVELPGARSAELAALSSEVAEQNGYASVEGHTIYTTYGDSDDWLFGNRSVAALTVELGSAFNPGDVELNAMVPKNIRAALTACEFADDTKRASSPEWTVMVYMAADNNLAQQALDDLNEMEQAANSTDVQTVVLYDGQVSGDSKIYKIAHDSDPVSVTSPAIDDQGAVINAATHEAAMNQNATLLSFMQWTASHYPSQKTALVLWDHGNDVVGGLCVDNGNWLGTIESCAAIRSFSSELGRPLDLVGLDLCWGGSLELASELSGAARVLVSSELEEPDTGWDYMRVLTTLGANVGMEPETLGVAIVDAYEQAYSGIGYATLTATSLGVLNEAISAWGDLSSALAGIMYYNRTAVWRARNDTGGIWNSKLGLVDVKAFCENLTKNSVPGAVKGLAENLILAISDATLSSFSSFDAKRAHGFYLYHPADGGYVAYYGGFGSATRAWREYLLEFDNPTFHPTLTPGGAPSARNTTGPYRVEAWLNDLRPQNASVELHYKYLGTARTLPMGHEGNGSFAAMLPGMGDGLTVEYWFTANDSNGRSLRYPPAPQTLKFSVNALLDLFVVLDGRAADGVEGSVLLTNVTIGNAGLEPVNAMVFLQELNGTAPLSKAYVFLAPGHNASVSLSWTPERAGPYALSVAIEATNTTVADKEQKNNTLQLNIFVGSKPEKDGFTTLLESLAITLAILAAVILLLYAYLKVNRRRMLRDKVLRRHDEVKAFVLQVSEMGYATDKPRELLDSAWKQAGLGNYELAEKMLDRADALAAATLKAGGEPPI